MWKEKLDLIKMQPRWIILIYFKLQHRQQNTIIEEDQRLIPINNPYVGIAGKFTTWL